MGIIQRDILAEAKPLLTQFRALCIIGPRQSGKTTLARQLLKQKPYVTLEDPSVQLAAEKDTVAFLQQFPEGVKLDEVQRVPAIFRYLQGMLDDNKKRGQFILTGSNNLPVEIKSARKVKMEMFSGLRYWLKYHPAAQALLIYGGEAPVSLSDQLQAVSWKEIGEL